MNDRGPSGKPGAGLLAAALLLSCLAPAPARAAPVGTIFSGPTTGDPVAAWWNPAAMTLVDGSAAMFFGSISSVVLDWDRATPAAFEEEPLNGERYPVAELRVPTPSISAGIVTDATLERWRFGFTFGIPVFEGAVWEREYGGKPAASRYYAYRGSHLQFNFQLSAAYEINRFISVGVGMHVVGVWLVHNAETDFGARINQAACKALGSDECLIDAPLPREDPSFDALTDARGIGWGVGGSVGILVTPLPWLRLGASFHTGARAVTVPVEMTVDLPQSVTDYLENNLPSLELPALKAEADVETKSPMWFTVGAAVQPLPELELGVDMRWARFSEMSVMYGNIRTTSSALITNQVLVREYDDDWEVGVRGAYQLLEPLRLALRLEYDPSIRPDLMVSPVSLDMSRIHIMIGAAWQVRPWLLVTFEYGHFFLLERNIEKSLFRPQALPQTPEEEGLDRPSATGVYSGHADRFGLGIEVQW